jgi:hypothetical protein
MEKKLKERRIKMNKITIKKRRKDGVRQRYHISTKGNSTNHLNEWKNTRNQKDYIGWDSTKSSDYVHIYKEGIYWRIVTKNGDSISSTYKSEALKEAKAYMRKH